MGGGGDGSVDSRKTANVEPLLEWYALKRKSVKPTNISAEDPDAPLVLENVVPLKRIAKLAGERVDILAVVHEVQDVSKVGGWRERERERERGGREKERETRFTRCWMSARD